MYKKINLLAKLAILSVFTSGLSGCGCYDSYEAAWAACNDKYNGKCRYLGSDFKVCKKKTSSKDIVPCTTDSDCASKNPHIDPYE